MTVRPFELVREPVAMPSMETDYDDHGSMRSRGPVVKAEHLFVGDLLRRGHRLFEVDRVAIAADGPVTVSAYPVSDGRRRIGNLQDFELQHGEWVRRAI